MVTKNTKVDNYSSEDYWNSRYDNNNNSHDWYYTFDILKPLIDITINKMTFPKVNNNYSNMDILEIGCGDRPLAIGISSHTPNTIIFIIQYW